MPAHDLPYFEPTGGQNAEVSSVVKAFGLARSRETAWPAAYRCGRERIKERQPHAKGSGAPLAGRHAPRGAPARCLAAESGAARVRRWWQVARLPRARATGRGYGTAGRHLRCHGHGPGRAAGPLRGTRPRLVAIWRGWPVRAWASQAPSKV
jgi:hypothetical protein